MKNHLISSKRRGDFKDEDRSKKEKSTLNYLKEIEKVYAEFNGARYHCVGNHDVDSISKKQFLENIENTGISKNKSYYSFDCKGYHFVVLDANFHKDGTDHFYKEGADWEDPNFANAQLNWLKSDLELTQYPTKIFCHHPLFEFHENGNKYHVNEYLQAQEILNNSNKVIAAVNGHVHKERFIKLKNIHYITQYGMIDYRGLENNSFSILELENSEIKLHGFKRSNSFFPS